jgi:hypothetical protein
MSRILITTDQCDFIQFDLNKRQVTYVKHPTPQLNAKHLKGLGRPTYRPFGIEYDEKFIYIVSNDRLGKFDKYTYEFKGLVKIPLFVNTHQIVKDKHSFYVCNTAIDCIGIYDFKHKKVRQYNVNFLNTISFHTEPQNATQLDSRHVNTLYNTEDKIYFCRHNKYITLSDYIALDKKTLQAEIIAHASIAGHGIKIHNDQLYSLSSGSGELLKINLSTGEQKYYKLVDNNDVFLRGLDIYDDKIIIGCSKNINSKSQQSAYLMIIDLMTGVVNKYDFKGIDFINDLKVIPD